MAGKKKVKKGLLASAATLLFPAIAHGQNDVNQTGAQASDIIVVTSARRQAEDIQDVPLTVTALTGDELTRQNITKPQDLQFAAPSVTVAGLRARLGGAYTIRGLRAGVISYFNEAPGGPTTIGMPFMDLASVEVLNGPQGTLFGRTAAAGAVLINPRRPDMNEFGGYFDVSIGNYGRLQAAGALNVPIVEDELALRIAYQHEHIDGFTKQITPPYIVAGLPEIIDTQDLDETHNDSARVGLQWKRGGFKNYLLYNHLNINEAPGSNVLTYANATISNLNLSTAAANATFGARCNSAFASGLITNVSACIAERVTVMNQIKESLLAEEARLAVGGKDAIRATPAFQGYTGYDIRKHDSIIDVAEYNFGDLLGLTTLSVKNIFSYQWDTGATAYSIDGIGGLALGIASSTANGRVASNIQVGNFVVLGGLLTETDLTEEFQLSGVLADALNWTAGLFYEKARDPDDPNAGPGSLSRSFAGLFVPNMGWSASIGASAGGWRREIAGYGQATLDLDEIIGVHGLSITGGYRYTDSTTTDRTYAAMPNPSGTGPYLNGPVSENSTDNSGSNYTVAITEEVTPDLLLYANHSKSFVPGGVNSVIGCELAPGCERITKPQLAKSYEIGFKSDFDLGDVILRFNANVFRIDFTNILQTFRFSTGALNIIYSANVAGARMQGLEAHADLLLPPHWDLSMNYSHLDAKYQNWIAPDPTSQSLSTDVCQPGSAGNLCLLDLSDNPFQDAPAHQFNAALRYHLPMDDSMGDAWLSVKGYYQSRQYHILAAARELELVSARLGRDVTEEISQAAYGVLNLRAQWDDIAGSNFTAALFVNNVTDKVYSQAGSNRAFTSGATVKIYAPPRMWGANLIYKF